MEIRRRRFFAALGVFMVWVIFLGVLSAVSGRQPPERARAAAPQ
jgi:hypothetical protein